MAVEFIIDQSLCSVNARYFVVRGRNVLSTQYRAVKCALVSAFTKYDAEEIPKPPYKITIQSHQYADIDAYIKIILDALQDARVIDNDKNVLWLAIMKTPIKKSDDQSHLIRVEHYDKV